jgi:hypothetical protein
MRTYNGNIAQWSHEKFMGIAQELYRVTRPCGCIVWIVADATVKGSETGSSFRQALYFHDIGFNLHDTMICIMAELLSSTNSSAAEELLKLHMPLYQILHTNKMSEYKAIL